MSLTPLSSAALARFIAAGVISIRPPDSAPASRPRLIAELTAEQKHHRLRAQQRAANLRRRAALVASGLTQRGTPRKLRSHPAWLL